MKKYLLLLPFLFSSALFAFAQQTKQLSVDELFGLGIENSLRVQASNIGVGIAGNRESSAKASRLPELSLGLIGGYIGQPTVFIDELSEAVHPTTPHWLQNYNVELTQPLFAGGKIKNNIERSSLETQIASLSLDRDKADVKLILMARYLDLFRLYKQHDVFEHNIKDARQRLHDINKMKKEGMITNNDVIRSELQLTNYQLALNETQDNIAIVSQQLDVALGLDED